MKLWEKFLQLLKLLKKGPHLARGYPLIFGPIFVIFIYQYHFSSIEAILYDLRIRYDFGIKYRDNIVLIYIDEESDEFLGEKYPYSYASHTRLIEKITKDRPKIINYLIGLLEPDSQKDGEQLVEFKTALENYKNDNGLFRFGIEMDDWGEQLPPETLREIGHSISLINVDNSAFSADDVVRRALLNISGEMSLHSWTANQFRKIRGQQPLDSNSILGSYYYRQADASFSLFRYYTSPLFSNGKLIRIPFHRAMVGNFPKGFFTDKIVLVGPAYISNSSDYVLTPFGREDSKASKLAVHAQIIESLIQNKTVYQLPRSYNFIICMILVVFLSVLNLKVNPRIALLITFIVFFSVIVLSYFLFSIFGIWIYLTHFLLSILAIYYIGVPFRAIEEYQRRFAIQEETKLLRQVENLKQNFISLMSHDLKTPLAKIAGIADLLVRQHRGPDDLVKGLNTIVDSTKELNKFITSILDLAKIESSDLRLNLVSKDVNSIIHSVIETLKYEALNKGIKVEFTESPMYPITIDVTLIKRVLSNLIENAIKYSGEGKNINIKTWDDNNWVYVEIRDNGIGIPENDLKHIFDRFYRVKNDSTHSIKGSGLGLYLVKYFVELHGGEITAESKFGEGTSFQIKLKNS